MASGRQRSRATVNEASSSASGFSDCDVALAQKGSLPPSSDVDLAARCGPAVQCARLMLLAALRRRSGFLQAASRPGTISVIKVPSDAWVSEVTTAWQLLADAVLSDTPCPKRTGPPIKAARRRYRKASKAPDTHFAANVQIQAPDDKTVQRVEKEVRDALARQASIRVISHNPERFLPRDLLLAADQHLIVPAPAASVLKELAHTLSGRVQRSSLRCLSVDLDELGALLTPNSILLGHRAGQRAHTFLRRLADLVLGRRSRSTIGFDRADVILEQLHGLGEAGEWALRAAADLRDHAAGRLAWSEVDRGIVIAGPPGSGKTTLARALANTAGVPFICASLPERQGDRDGHLGTLLGAMRRTFDEARAVSPCVLLIDEIDSFGDRALFHRNHRGYSVQVVNVFLEQLDGAAGRSGVLVIGACNDASRLDPAITRAERLARVAQIQLPNAEALARIFRHHLGNALADGDLAGVALAAEALRAAGADVERWCRGARRRARTERRGMTLADVVAEVGPPPPDLTPEERCRIAIHEAGHAVAYAAIGPEMLRRVSVSWTGQTGGMTEVHPAGYMLPRLTLTRSELRRRLRALLAGRAAELELLGEVSGGAGGTIGSDLAAATRLAALAVGSLGLAEHPEELVFRGGADLLEKAESLGLDPDLRARVAALLRECHDDARRLISLNRCTVERLAEALLRRGYLNGAEALEIIGRVTDRDVPQSSTVLEAGNRPEHPKAEPQRGAGAVQ